VLDPWARRHVDPWLDRAAAVLEGTPVSANAVTVAGFALGIAGAVLIAFGHPGWGLVAMLAGRVLDGLDGAVARRRGATDLGGYLDIVLDFIVYASLGFAFAVLDPERNALPAAFLLLAFMGTGSSFLAFAVMAAKRRIETTARGPKSLFYLGGLTEGFETILFFSLCCLVPVAFPVLAWTFAAMCWITTATRIAQAVLTLRG
jgi:phosphatidylglycerophosphate synthase